MPEPVRIRKCAFSPDSIFERSDKNLRNAQQKISVILCGYGVKPVADLRWREVDYWLNDEMAVHTGDSSVDPRNEDSLS